MQGGVGDQEHLKKIEHVRQALDRSLMKPIHTAARQLELPHSTVHKSYTKI